MNDLKNIYEADFLDEIVYQTSRSSGAGGQNVNKVETKVSLRFSINESKILDENQKNRLKSSKLSTQLISEDVIQIICQESRSQLKNKEIALKKLKQILINSLHIPKVRKPAKIPAEIIKKRLIAKKHNSEIKANRNKIVW